MRPEEFIDLAGPTRGERLAGRVETAIAAFEEERFPDARSILRPIVTEVPASPTARELLGLVQYRLGHYGEAAKQLEAYYELVPGSVEHHPVLADCYRAKRRYSRVDQLWTELREVSPSADLVTEGRIVAAGALADQGRVADAIRTMEKGWKLPKRPREHHLRRAYVLADLYDRAGETVKARSLFGWLDGVTDDYFDVAERRAALD